MRKRKILALLLALSMICGLLPIGALAQEGPEYGDIDGHYAESQITKWSDFGILQGDGGSFQPDSPITRAQMATVLVRLLGLTEKSGTKFTDMTAGAWYTDALLKCAAAGIFKGNGDGTIGPNDPLTREQAAVILSRAFDIMTGKMSGTVELVSGATVTSSAIKAAVAQAAEKSGGVDGTYTGTANGVYGALEVTVTVKNGKITACEVSKTSGENEGANLGPDKDPKKIMSAAYVGMDVSSSSVSFTDGDAIADWSAAFVAGMAKLGFLSGRPDGSFDPKAPMKRAELVKLVDNIVKGYYNKTGSYPANISGNLLVNAPLTLKNVTINGDLIITEGAEDTILEGVTVKGRIILRGGKLKADNTTKATGGVAVLGDATLVGTFGEVEVKGDDSEVLLEGATIANLRVPANGAMVIGDKNSWVAANTVTGTGSKFTPTVDASSGASDWDNDDDDDDEVIVDLPGNYTGTATGSKLIKVTVTVTDGVITAVIVDGSGESDGPSYGKAAIEKHLRAKVEANIGKTPSAALADQSNSAAVGYVDVVTGATLTSNGVHNAFVKALQKAIGAQFPPLSFNAGTYSGTGKGFGGNIVLDVTFSATAITDIKLASQRETVSERIPDTESDHIGDPAYPIMIDWIKKFNSTTVDTVTGATFTSKGVIAAVEDAAVKAGCSLDDIRRGSKPFVYTPEATTITGTYDVVIVGAGGAGLSAAAAAAEEMGEGGTVLVIEQMTEVGGNTFASGGCAQAVRREEIWEPEDPTNTANGFTTGYVVPGITQTMFGPMDTRFKSTMVTGYIDMLETILAWDETDFNDKHSNSTTPEYLRGVHAEYLPTLKTLKQQVRYYLDEYAYPALEAGTAEDKLTLFDSMELHIFQTYYGGLRYDLEGNAIYGNYDLVYQVCARSRATQSWLAADSSLKFNNSSATIIGSLWKRIKSTQDKWTVFMASPKAKLLAANGDNEIMYRTEAYKLIMEDGRVIGVKARRYDGTEVEMTATRGVIMATGGFANNIEMVNETNNYWPKANLATGTLYTTNRNTSNGEGIKMAQAVGADVVGMEFMQLMPSAYYDDGKLCGASGPSLIYIAPKNSNMNTNSDMNPEGEIWDGKRYVDENAERDVLSLAAYVYGEGLRGNFIQLAKASPPWGSKPGTPIQVTPGFEYYKDTDTYGNKVGTGVRNYTASLAAVAEDLGIPAETLKKTVMDYDTAYANKDMSHVPDAPKSAAASFIGSGRLVDPDATTKVLLDTEAQPYVDYLTVTRLAPSTHHTMGGLVVDNDRHVINTNGDIIPGLFAAGEVTGGIFAGNRLGGNAVAEAYVSGRIAGEVCVTGDTATTGVIAWDGATGFDVDWDPETGFGDATILANFVYEDLRQINFFGTVKEYADGELAGLDAGCYVGVMVTPPTGLDVEAATVSIDGGAADVLKSVYYIKIDSAVDSHTLEFDWDAEHSETFTVNYNAFVTGVEVTSDGDAAAPAAGDELKAYIKTTFGTIDADTSIDEAVYKWYYEGETDPIGDDSTYTVRTRDAGLKIYVDVKITGCSGLKTWKAAKVVSSAKAGLIEVLEEKITATGTGSKDAPKTAAITVDNSVDEVDSSDVTADPSAVITFYGTDDSFTAEKPDGVELTAGDDTDIYIKVVSEDGETTLYYQVTITRKPLQSGSPALSETPEDPATFGTELTAGPGTLTTTTDLTYTWYRSADATFDAGDEDDEGDTELKTGTTYTPVKDDIGKYLIVVATSADATGSGTVATAAAVVKAAGPAAPSGTIAGTSPEAATSIELTGLGESTAGLEAAVAIDGIGYGAYADLSVSETGTATITGLTGVTPTTTKVKIRVAETDTHEVGADTEITVTAAVAPDPDPDLKD